MDFSLFAPKLFISEVQSAEFQEREAGPPVCTIGDLVFQRVWLQGLIVAVEGATLAWLDDGSGVARLDLRPEDGALCRPGMYVQAIGAPTHFADPQIKVHKLVDLSGDPNRESLWVLEVVDLHHKMYDGLMFVDAMDS